MAKETSYRAQLRQLSDEALHQAHVAARSSVEAWAATVDEYGSLLQSWIRGREVLIDARYPESDITDRTHGFQFFYHSHRHSSLEHGHLHLFCHARKSGRRRYLNSETRSWRRTAPSHLFAIGLDNRGIPVSIFTVNRWVTDGYWHDAATTLAIINRFRIELHDAHRASGIWLTGFVRMYQPLIKHLIQRRDVIVSRKSGKRATATVLEDRRLDLICMTTIDWLRDIELLEKEAERRSRKP